MGLLPNWNLQTLTNVTAIPAAVVTLFSCLPWFKRTRHSGVKEFGRTSFQNGSTGRAAPQVDLSVVVNNTSEIVNADMTGTVPARRHGTNANVMDADQIDLVEPRALVERAYKLAVNGDLDRSIKHLKALLRNPDADSVLLREAGHIANKNVNDYPLAKALFSRALQLDSRDVRAQVSELILDAEREVYEGKFLVMVDTIIETVRTNFGDLRLIAESLDFLNRRRKTVEVIDLVNELLQRDCHFKHVLFLERARAERIRDFPSDIVKATYDRAIQEAQRQRLRSGDSKALVESLVSSARYLMLLREANDIALACDRFEEAVNLARDDPEPLRAAAEFFRSFGQPRRAHRLDQQADRVQMRRQGRSGLALHLEYGEPRPLESARPDEE